ncbi:MAG TPA: isochorismatase family protein [Candidatus Acidoferrales bacterium]|nr:isochorismatase family protein [Candidatus Acidoferrales bacterium]
MPYDFEDHCWKDVVSGDVLDLYSRYRRKVLVGPSPALLAVDLYELAYEGGAKPISEISNMFPSSCGEHAWAAIEPTERLFAAARSAKIPVFYTTMDVRPNGRPEGINATKRRAPRNDAAAYAIRSNFKPGPDDVILPKQRASAFFGTPLQAHLTELGVRTVIVCGESTSGCVRASAVDAYSYGFHVVLVEECCFDRSVLSHKINLFDLHHKYADVLHVDEAEEHLKGERVPAAR